MVRAIKPKTAISLNKGERALLLPGPTLAEPWELWAIGSGPGRCLETCPTPAASRWGGTTTLALPLREVFCVPLWLNETDADKLGAMIPLQLELRGLMPRAHEAAVSDWSVVLTEATRTLVVVGILPAALSKEVREGAHQLFDLSARCLSLPEDSLVLWQEQDRLALAITRGKNLVYFQSLAGAHLTPALLQDLNCIRETLVMQDVLTAPRQVLAWAEMDPVALDSLQKTLHLPARKAIRPAPQFPAQAWKLVPTQVTQEKIRRERRRWQARGLFLALLVFVLVALGLVAQLLLTEVRVNELQKWTGLHAPALAEIHETRTAWKELRPVVDDKSFPLELLLHASQAIPADQLHLTLFEATDGHLLIKAEAKDVSAAFQFLDRLKKDSYFSAYTWEMAQPHLLPNDLAQLQIEGTRASGDSE